MIRGPTAERVACSASSIRFEARVLDASFPECVSVLYSRDLCLMISLIFVCLLLLDETIWHSYDKVNYMQSHSTVIFLFSLRTAGKLKD